MTDNQIGAMVDIVMIVADSDEDGKVGESEVVKAVLTDVAGSSETHKLLILQPFTRCLTRITAEGSINRN